MKARRLEPPDETTLTEADRALCRHLVETRGWLPEVFAVGLHSPDLMQRVAAIGTYFRLDSGLDAYLRELVTLTVAHETGSVYEWTHHIGPARAAGLDDETIALLIAGGLADEQSLRGAATRYARLIARGADVDDDTFATLRQELGEKGLYELTILAVFYLAQARTIVALGVRVEDGVEAQTFEGLR